MPPPEIRRQRDLTRLCIAQVEERTRAIQRLEKVLQDAGIKLSSVASTSSSVSARAMLETRLAGISDPAELAELAKARLRAKISQLREANRWLRKALTTGQPGDGWLKLDSDATIALCDNYLSQ